jgi:hypothetical protein
MLRTLLEPFDLSSSQHNEMAIAYDENPAGFTALVARVSTAKNPTAALIATVRKGEHDGAERTATTSSKPARDTLDDIVAIALRMYTARIKKYPAWGESSAIDYGAEFAPSWNRRFTFDEVRAGLCRRLNVENEGDFTPTQPPAEMLERMKRMAKGIGDMPKPKPIVAPDPEPVVELTLAERLLEMAGKAA